jgi:hypothetical protein
MSENRRHKRPKRKLISIRIPLELLEWGHKLAQQKNTTFTQVVVDQLTILREKHDSTG